MARLGRRVSRGGALTMCFFVNVFQGRGMELSELVHWKGKLYSFDDRTGIVFEILPSLKVIPKHILMEGNGDENKGQKTEWVILL